MHSADQVLKQENIFLKQATIGGISCSVGYIKKFKWSWFATQLNTFVIIGDTNSLIDKSTIENFSSACLKYALQNNQGWPRGLQSGIGSIAILMGSNVSVDAIAFCEKPTKKHWSAFEIPVIYDESQRRIIRYIKTPIWGKIYFGFFTNLIDSVTGKL